MSQNSARILIVGELCYICVHTIIYAIGLKFWNVVTPYYLLMWFLEEIPNAYSLLVCIASQIDPSIPANIVSSDSQLQNVLYIWKPFVNVLAFIVLILDLFPIAFGLYIFYYADGSKDRDIGQATMMEALANTLPYIYSLILLCLTMTYI